MLIADDCKKGEVWVYKMKYVPFDHCKSYYRRTGLDFDTLWPAHTTCAQSVLGGECVWRSGAILVTKVDHRWRLLGFGVYGPGCQAPARFLDYGMYHTWVKETFTEIGKPVISTIADNHLVMRRTMSKIQRLGTCDSEEMKYELFSDATVLYEKKEGTYKYNLTLVAGMEYSCMEVKARYVSPKKTGKPKLTLRRWCAGEGHERPVCHSGTQFVEIAFYVEITFEDGFVFQLNAYGEQMKVIDPLRAHKYRNTRTKYPNKTKTKDLWPLLKKVASTNLWFRKPKPYYYTDDHSFWKPGYYKQLLVEYPRPLNPKHFSTTTTTTTEEPTTPTTTTTTETPTSPDE
ncbi:uncharacterized protein LOC118279081 [Spodoptera frugiperda]|uniref:Uncharacterized protein LOC118279081 n=1 Tax=Spodoptera frugiperda TaxID=7108 RepID=A0A9R0DWE9_SPOFR|nr:uncharacterized protein LOC118279081 [Spodoptera frugiperda]